jgi:hypothetical protein
MITPESKVGSAALASVIAMTAFALCSGLAGLAAAIA